MFSFWRGSEIDVNDGVVLYPSFAHLDPTGDLWNVEVQGFVHDPISMGIQHRIMLNLLGRYMKAQSSLLQGELFQQRIHGFLTPAKRNRWIRLRAGKYGAEMQTKSRFNGHFSGRLKIPTKTIRHLEADGDFLDGWLNYRVCRADGADTTFQGTSRLVEHEGVSVISDIDDTIKHTQVHCRHSLLTNTFLREFRAVDGMADLYQQWARRGATFHYVSSSPWQLYNPLAALCREAGFPAGSFHLQPFGLAWHMLNKLLLFRRGHKEAVIDSILSYFPRRRFVLVGDSGERDPEIYGRMAAKHPRQVAAIFIRELPETPMSLRRSRLAFAHVSEGGWFVFQSPEDLANRLPVG